MTLKRDKPRPSGRGRIARTAQPSYNGVAADNQGSLRQGMPEVTPVEIRVAVAHSAQEPTEATQGRLNAAPERRRNLRPSGRGGCQKKQITLDNGNGRIKLPKLGWLRYRKSRDVLGEVRSATVSQSGGKWFVSILTERTVDKPIPQGGAVGIDVGIARFATLSDGSFIEPLNSFRKYESRLRRYQRAMSRKTKFSSNWKKAKAKVQKIHTRIANVRKDFLHKASATISKNHALVVVEDLKVSNMSRSAKGTVDAPGRNVRAKSGLNKSILDQGWGEFRRQLEYKMAWKGGYLVAIPPQYTSQTCPCCGHVSKDNRQTQAKFECVDCGFEENADKVGAINILAAGHAVYACGGMAQSGHPVKQEPAKATTQEFAHA